MAYDEKLAERVRAELAQRKSIAEKKMFGGLCFLERGNMLCGLVGDTLMARVGPDGYESALERPHVKPMDFTGKPLKGMVYVEPEGVKTKPRLKKWIGECAKFVDTLPEKKPKTRAAKRVSAKRAKAKPTDESVPFEGFGKGTRDFLAGLEANNSKSWFEAHRDDYEAHYLAPALAFVREMGPRLRKISKTVNFEPRVNGSLFRVNRDVRFSKDKTPYKAHIDMWFWEGETKGWDTPGFFIRVAPRTLILGVGLHHFTKPQLAAYRDAVVANASGKALERAVADVKKAGPYEVTGPRRKTVPRGYDTEHARADWLLYEGLHAEWSGKLPAAAKSADFVEWCADHWKRMVPVHRWLLRTL